jgi:MFS family permease
MEYLGGGVGALAAGWLIHRVNWRVAISIVCIVAMLLTLLGAAAHTLLLVATLRLLNAAALGFIYAIGVFGIGRSQQPDRFFGVFSPCSWSPTRSLPMQRQQPSGYWAWPGFWPVPRPGS